MGDQRDPKLTPTLDALLQKEYGLRSHPGPETGVVAVGTTATKLCSNNPNRIGLSFQNLGSGNIYVYLDNTVSANKGRLIAGGGGSLDFDWRVDTTLISNDWYGMAPGGVTNLQVIETVTE